MLLNPNSEKIIAYLKKALASGLDLDSARDNLFKAGYGIEEVDHALQVIEMAKEQKPSSIHSLVTFTPLEKSPFKETRAKVALPFFSWEFYLDLLSGTQKLSAFLLIFVLSLAATIKPSYELLNTAKPLVANLPEKIQTLINNVYPEKLEIKIDQGTVSTNVTEPYFIDISRDIFSSLSVSRVRILAIDTGGKADDFERYQALALLTKTSLVYYNDNSVKIQSLRNIQNLTINRDLILAKLAEVNRGNRLQSLLTIGLTAAPFIIFIILLLEEIFTCLLLSLLVLILAKISQQIYPFGHLFVYTVSIIFLPKLLLNFSSFIPGNPLIIFSSFLTIIVLGIAYSGLQKAKEASA